MQWVVTTAVILNWKVISDFLCHCLPPFHLYVESSLAFFFFYLSTCYAFLILETYLTCFSPPCFWSSFTDTILSLRVVSYCCVWLMYGVHTMSDPRGLQADGGCVGMSIVGEQYITTSLFSSLCFPMGSLLNTRTSRWLKRGLCIHSYRLISQLLLISEDS